MKRINRVIFFFGTKFTKRDYKRFGIGKIKKRGYSVEIWDFTPWWKPNYSKKYLPSDLYDFKHIKTFYNMKLKNEINGFVNDGNGGYTAKNIANRSHRRGVESKINYKI